MKNILSALAVLFISVFLITGFIKAPGNFSGSIKGTINPADAGIRAWAISNKDTFRTVVIEGVFVIADVKPGLYNLMVEAKSPYKNGGIPEVTVIEGETADVGEIKLSK